MREVLRRLYLGSEIGQGYGGDEDNGETSAWYLFSALGFYPLQVGSENYVIGSPLFKKATVHLENGRDLVVKAPRQQRAQRLCAGPEAQRRGLQPLLHRHRDIAGGGTLEFDMGPSPSSWATGTDAVPPSVTKGDEPAQPLRDTTGGDDGTATTSGGAAAALFDDDSSTVASLTGSRPWLQYRFTGSRPVSFYTLTSGTAGGGDPSAWVVKGSNDGSRLEGARRAQRRDVPLALADAAVQALASGQLRLLPDRGHQRAAARSARSSCSTRARPTPRRSSPTSIG